MGLNKKTLDVDDTKCLSIRGCPERGQNSPAALLGHRPKCSLTVQKRTLGAHFGLASSHGLGLTYSSKYNCVDLPSLLVPLSAA